MPVNTRRLEVILEGVKYEAEEPEIEVTAQSKSQVAALFDPDEDHVVLDDPIVFCPCCSTSVFVMDFDEGDELRCSLCGFEGEREIFNVG